MGFDLTALRHAVATHGTVARVVIADVRGSAPREVGAAMLVWDGGQSGTIGGGTLEYQSAQIALSSEGLTRHALGPDLGQCCGGAVVLLTEHFDAARVDSLEGQGVVARGPGDMPLSVRRVLDAARAKGVQPQPGLIDGWMVEPVEQATRDIWVWGAGHVGRAIVTTLSPLPDFAITWVDTGPARFPDVMPPGVTAVPAAQPERLMTRAPLDASHLILTYSHELDLALCHAALSHGFAFAGLIGSKTKWARFRKRLQSLGHDQAAIEQITCPIGNTAFGKHPQAIAIGVAGSLLGHGTTGKDMDWILSSSLSAG